MTVSSPTKHNPMETNQMFSQMYQAARNRLAGQDPADIARNAGVDFHEESQRFSFSSLGIGLTVSYPDYTIRPQIAEWHQLVVLHYLNLADGAPLTGRDIPLAQMASGMVRGRQNAL